MQTRRGKTGKPAAREAVALRLRVAALKEGGYLATSPDVPGLVAEGRSIMEAVEIAQGLTRRLVESCLEHGDPLPRALRALPGGAVFAPARGRKSVASGVSHS